MAYNYAYILPDPTYAVDDAGFQQSGFLGQKFKSVQLEYDLPYDSSVSIEGKTVVRTNNYSGWKIKITYNPMVFTDFTVIDSFLSSRLGMRGYFYVILPQHSKPKDSKFDSWTLSNDITFTNPPKAGSTSEEITTSGWSGNIYTTTGLPSVGDFFNIDDPLDTLHKKTYIVTAVETNGTYVSGNQPQSGSIRIHFSPGIQRKTNIGSKLIFQEPKFRVQLAKEVFKHQIDTEGLYEFSLELKEAQD